MAIGFIEIYDANESALEQGIDDWQHARPGQIHDGREVIPAMRLYGSPIMAIEDDVLEAYQHAVGSDGSFFCVGQDRFLSCSYESQPQFSMKPAIGLREMPCVEVLLRSYSKDNPEEGYDIFRKVIDHIDNRFHPVITDTLGYSNFYSY